LEGLILQRIHAVDPGSVFTPNDFLDIGTRAAVDQALSRSARRGVLRRLARGLYSLPRSHRIWGPLPPPPEAVVAAVARRDGVRVIPAAPGSVNAFLTEGRSRKLRIGKSEIALKHAPSRRLALAALPAGDVLLALLALGRPDAEAAAPERLRALGPERRAALRAARRHTPVTPAWLSDLLKEHGC